MAASSSPDRRPWTWPWLVATTLARAVLITVLCLSLWGALPTIIGWKATTVSSGSMMPRLHVGDIAVSRPVGTTPPGIGSVLLFDDPDHPGRLRMHRLVDFDDQGRLVTRGDANAGNDSSPVEWAAVRGIGTLRIPYVALPIVWLREGAWLKVGLVVAVLTGLIALTAQSRRFAVEDEKSDDDQPDDDGGPDLGGPDDGAAVDPQAATRAPRPTTHRTDALTFAALAGAVALVTTLAVPAEAAFKATTATTASFALGTYATCAAAIDASSPYLWYRMDESSSTTTTATDSSGNGRTGTYRSAGKTAGATKACSADTGSAMTFNGSSGYLSSPLVLFAPSTFTLELWFRTTTTRGGKLIGFGSSQTGASASYDRHIYLTDAGKLIFGVYASDVSTVTSPRSYNDGDWHHVAATLSSAGQKLYVDGSLVDSSSNTSVQLSILGYWRVAYDNLSGWPSDPSSDYLAGTLDDVAVFTTALSATQIQAQYAAGL